MDTLENPSRAWHEVRPWVYFILIFLPPLLFLQWLVTLVIRKVRHKETLPLDRFILRNTANGHIILRPGSRYKKKPEDTLVSIRPDRNLFSTPAGPRLVRWQADPDNLEAYVEFYRPLRDSARVDFIRGLTDFFVLNSSPTVNFLQDRYANHLGVKILTVDVPPQPEQPNPQPRDPRSPVERAIAKMRTKVQSTKQLQAFWDSLPNDPDFADMMRDQKARTVLRGEFDQIMSDIAQGRFDG